MYFVFQSKVIMFDFFYNKLMTIKDCAIELGMTDTDSFLFSVTNPKEFWSKIEPYMDFSNYPEDHPKFSLKNKAQLGYFKDELGGVKECKGFVGLRAKCYSMKLQDRNSKATEEKKVCKGIGRTAIKNRLRYKQYLDCLKGKGIVRHHFTSIRSRNHEVSTVKLRKKALSHFDSKRYLFACGIHSVPFGSIVRNTNKNKCPFC